MASNRVDSTENTDWSHFERRCERRPEIIARRLSDKTVLLNGTTGACFELNHVGTAIWDTLDGSRTWGDISDELARRFARPTADVAVDVKRLAEQLQAAALIRLAQP
jgi:hypothetical protein